MPAAEFWRLTPREYAAHRRLFDEREKQHAYTVATFQATLHNAWFKRKDEPERGWTPADFLPEAMQPPRRVKTWQEMMNAFTGIVQTAGNKTG